jgi:predicted CXXCH cytochrome family protein
MVVEFRPRKAVDGAVAQALATCPSCHTSHRSLTEDAVAGGADWSCARCHQNWDAARLETAGAYARWDEARRNYPA